METDNSNQWELEGRCSLCRRKNYCSKPCTRNTRATNALMEGMVTSYLDRATGGAFSEIMSRSKTGGHY